MRPALGYVLLAVWVIGFLAELARNVWQFAAEYHQDERFRARADRLFTAPRPGAIGWIIRVLTTALIFGSGLVLNAAMWPTGWLFDWIDRREHRRAGKQPKA